ncbi:MAG TPA: family 10 glycosylhydrolase [Kofleriaceae bacterium]|nr:family 10 glycosylhydrolase [Kofleriaceae bacterium]
MRSLVAIAALLAACEEPSALAPDAAVTLPDAPGGDADVRPRELRGVWITRFAYNSRASLEAIIDRAAGAHFNAVFVQIRGEGDAYYRSAVEPWSARLSGVLGRDPGWDPLQVAIDRAHMHGMELHAYFNVFTAWSASTTIPTAEGSVQHALIAHPEWLAVDSTNTNRDTEYRWFAQGNPAVHAHIVAVAQDLLSHYDVDGLHLDRIRTPGPDYSRDAATTAAYNAAKAANASLAWADFMRGQVSTMVAEIHDVLVATRPHAKLSASVWGIYQPLPSCSTSQGYGQFYQDSRGWLASGTMDALAPMIYWPIEPGACTDWATLLDGFVAADAGRQIWAGMEAVDDPTWDFTKVQGRIERSRVAGAAGTMVFSSTALDGGAGRWDAFVGTSEVPGPYAEVALPPAMAWK